MRRALKLVSQGAVDRYDMELVAYDHSAIFHWIAVTSYTRWLNKLTHFLIAMISMISDNCQ